MVDTEQLEKAAQKVDNLGLAIITYAGHDHAVFYEAAYARREVDVTTTAKRVVNVDVMVSTQYTIDSVIRDDRKQLDTPEIITLMKRCENQFLNEVKLHG